METDKTKLRARFAALDVEKSKAEQKLAPMHAELEALRAETLKREDTLIARIKKTREPLVAIDEERAMISRALNGKTTDPAELATE